MRLYSDLQHSPGRRYFFDLASTPGIVTPGAGLVTLSGNVPIAVERVTVFRTPATIVLTLNGQSLATPTDLHPGLTTLTFSGTTGTLFASLTITPSLESPIESPEPDFSPTILTEFTVSPGRTTISLHSIELNVAQGGNIGFVTPLMGTLSVAGLAYVFNIRSGVGQATLQGLAPTIKTELLIEPNLGNLTLGELSPRMDLPFHWVADDPAPSITWISDHAA